jgi:hypothetical protein
MGRRTRDGFTAAACVRRRPGGGVEHAGVREARARERLISISNYLYSFQLFGLYRLDYDQFLTNSLS